MADKQPVTATHRAYSVIRREGQDDYWLNIGAAFPHDDGKGYNIILQAHPIGEKLVVRLYEPKEKEGQAAFDKKTG